MAELWYGHFDSTAEDPRELLAADWAKFIASFITDGVRNGGTNLQVTAAGGMSVKVDNGIACIGGYIMRLETDLGGRYYQVAVPAAHPQHPRIDRLVLRLEPTDARTIKPMLLMGTAASAPTPPALTRTNNMWELSLCQIRVNANALSVSDSNITDERFSTEACGIMNSVLGLDPSVWQARFDEFIAGIGAANQGTVNFWTNEYNALKTSVTNEFNAKLSQQQSIWQAWFDTIKIDLPRYSSFDFDNLAALTGVEVTTASTGPTEITETIKIISSGLLVAVRVTVSNANGTMTKTEKVYNSNGVSILRQTAITTTLNPDGSIKEVVS